MFNSLRIQMLALVLLATIGAAVLSLFFAGQQLYQDDLRHHQRFNTSLAFALAREVHLNFRALSRELRILGTQPSPGGFEGVVDPDRGGLWGDKHSLQAMAFLTEEGEKSAVEFRWQKDEVPEGRLEELLRWMRLQEGQQPVFLSSIATKSEASALLMAVPSSTGLLGAVFETQKLLRWEKGSEWVRPYLFTLEGQILLHSEQQWDPRIGEKIKPMLSGEDGSTTKVVFGEQTCLVSLKRIAGLPLAAVVVLPISTFPQFSRETKHRALLFVVVMACLALLIGIYFAARLSQPFEKLRDAATAIAEGQLGVAVGVKGPDELIKVADSFNAMSRELVERDYRLRQIDRKLRYSERLALAGALGSGVAHEINNPLSYVIANLDYAIITLRDHFKECSPLESIQEALEDSKEGAERIQAIVQALRSFARDDQELTRLLDVRSVLDSSIRLAWMEMKNRIEVEKDYGDVPQVMGNDASLCQVFLNVLLTATQCSTEHEAEEKKVRVSTALEQDKVLVTFSDSKVHLEESQRAGLFNPFFAARSMQTSAGLGLAISRSSVQGFGGQLTVESDERRGYCFRICLPSAVQNHINKTSDERDRPSTVPVFSSERSSQSEST